MNFYPIIYFRSLIISLLKHFDKIAFLFIFFILPITAYTQTPQQPANTTEQQLEDITENNNDTETEDDIYQQQMQEFTKHPINLNNTSADELKQLRILTPIQIQNFMSYRNLMGKLIDIYELQAIPAWNIIVIKKILPFIILSDVTAVFEKFRNRLGHGEHSMLVRVSQTLEKSKGYLLDSSTATNFYPGSPQKLLMRYKYQFKNLWYSGRERCRRTVF
jgi:Helix-hairpin-helix motif